MSILVSCECGQEHRTGGANAGHRARCRACGRLLTIPRSGPEPGPELDDVVELEPLPSGKAAASMVLGVVSMTCGLLTGLPAIVLGSLGLREIRDAYGRLRGRSMAWTGITTGLLGSLFVVLGLAGNGGRIRDAQDRAKCLDRLQRIGSALVDYATTEGRLPPAAIAGPGGKPLLSWRVAILPYLGEHALYRKFKLDEPWDSPHNRMLLETPPACYRCPALRSGAAWTTSYQVFVGPGTPFDGPRGVALDEIRDGTATTFLVVDADRPVPWTKPQDIPFNPAELPRRIRIHHRQGFCAVCADGTTKLVPAQIDPGTLRAYITRAGGEVIRRPF